MPNPTQTKTDSQVQKSGRTTMSAIFGRIIGQEKEISKYQHIVDEIKRFDDKLARLEEIELQSQTKKFRLMLAELKDRSQIERKLQEVLPEAFATVREAASRVIGQKHYEVQLIGGMVLNEGRVSEMRTGEGKTLVSTLAGYLNALPVHYQVHLVT